MAHMVLEEEVWVAPEVGKHLAVCGPQNNTSVQAWLLFVEHLLCARHLGELFKHMISLVIPYPARRGGQGGNKQPQCRATPHASPLEEFRVSFFRKEAVTSRMTSKVPPNLKIL